MGAPTCAHPDDLAIARATHSIFDLVVAAIGDRCLQLSAGITAIRLQEQSQHLRPRDGSRFDAKDVGGVLRDGYDVGRGVLLPIAEPHEGECLFQELLLCFRNIHSEIPRVP